VNVHGTTSHLLAGRCAASQATRARRLSRSLGGGCCSCNEKSVLVMCLWWKVSAVPDRAVMAPPARHALTMMWALTLAVSASRGLAQCMLSLRLMVCAGETCCGGGVGVKVAEMVCVKFEYLGYEKSQDLCGGGEHAGSGSDELVPLFRWGTGQGEGVLEDILLPCRVLDMCI
jgi:hypothetical protein